MRPLSQLIDHILGAAEPEVTTEEIKFLAAACQRIASDGRIGESSIQPFDRADLTPPDDPGAG